MAGSVGIRLIEKNQYTQNRHVELERRFLAIPPMGLPHQKPFPAHHHKAKKPHQKAEGEAGGCACFGAVKVDTASVRWLSTRGT